MLPETLSEIEARIEKAGTLTTKQRAELLKLTTRLHAEVLKLAKTNEEDAQSVVHFTRISAHEATRERPNSELLTHSINGLELSVTEFEESHPKLVDVVNRFATALADLGI